MIVLTDEQRRQIVAQLSGAALKRLKGLGIDLAAAPPDPIPDPAGALATLTNGDYVRDAAGFLWQATDPFASDGRDRFEIWLAPFDDRMAFQIIGQPGDQPPRIHAVHPTAVPTFPLTRLDIP